MPSIEIDRDARNDEKRRAKIDALSRWMPDLRPRDILAGKIYLGSRCVAAGAKFDFLFEYVYFKDSCVEDSSPVMCIHLKAKI